MSPIRSLSGNVIGGNAIYYTPLSNVEVNVVRRPESENVVEAKALDGSERTIHITRVREAFTELN